MTVTPRTKRHLRHVYCALGFVLFVYFTIVAPPLPKPEWRAAVRVAAAAILLWGLAVEPRWLRVREQSVSIRGLHPDLHGLRVAHVSDVHFGPPGMSAGDVRRVVRRVLDTQPDLIALTGDYVNGKVRLVEPLASLLGPLQAPLGVFAVLGNHDPIDRSSITDAFSQSGFQVLNNRAAVVRAGEATVAVVGVDDPSTGRHDLDLAMEGVPTDRDLTLLLAHSPSIAAETHDRGIDLTLCGHTHGGQVRFPQVVRKQPERDRTDDGPALCVSAGVGHRFPFRLLCRPEVPLVVLREAGSTEAPCLGSRTWMRRGIPESGAWRWSRFGGETSRRWCPADRSPSPVLDVLPVL